MMKQKVATGGLYFLENLAATSFFHFDFGANGYHIC